MVLSDRIEINRHIQALDAFGQLALTNEVVGSLWAVVEPVAAIAQVIADQEKAVQTYNIKVRYAGIGAQIKLNDLIIWRGLTLRVTSAPISTRERYRHLQATSGTET